MGTPERAEGEKKYLKSDLEFFGVTMPDLRRVVKGATPADLTHDELIAIVEGLWSKPIHERRMAAVVFLGNHPALLGPRDLPVIERLIRESKTWAYVDGLAVVVVGELIIRHPGALETLDRWAADDDFWIRRSALLGLLRSLRTGRLFTVFAGYAEPMLEEKEFFIRKAIGWVLRETAKENADEIFDWLAPRTHRASGVTMREAVKYLDLERREILMSAYKEKRPATRSPR